MMVIHDDAVFVNNDIGGKDEPEIPYEDEGDRYPSNNNWLVPSRPVDESKLKKNFDPDSVAAAVVPSPMWGIRLNITSYTLFSRGSNLTTPNVCEFVCPSVRPSVRGQIVKSSLNQ